MKLQNLRTNHLDCPLGYQFDYLLFSWEVTETDDTSDEWTLIEIALDEKFDEIVYTTGYMEHYGRPYFCPDFVPLCETRYYWRVTLSAKLDGIVTSNPVWFETALTKGQWDAKWIAAEKEERVMPEFYKTIFIERPVKKARLYSYGVGIYEAYINDIKVGNEFLMPGYHSYDFVNQYQTFDITNELEQGENKLLFCMGEGWYKGRFVFEGGYENLYGDRKKLIAIVKVEFEDGSRFTVSTDESWLARESAILSNNIYDGEVIDEQTAKKDISVIVLDDTKEMLCARWNAPLRKVEEYPVKEIILTPSGQIVLDFGEMITGWVEVKGYGEMNFNLQYGELMQYGELYRENLRTAKAEFSYRGMPGEKWIRPHFTYYGFRYVQVNGIEDIDRVQFRACRLMSDIRQSGSIVTSDEKVNKLIENTLRSQKCNFIDVPLDCPQRDERLGWTGDIALFVNTGSYHMETAAFLHHYMMNLKLEQKALDGAVPFFVPKPKPEFHEGINPFLITAGACTWGDAATIVPWTLYEHYEDKEMLGLHYPVMKAWVEYVNGRVKENPKPYLWQNDRHLGDWLALDNGNIHSPIGNTDMGLIATAYYYYSTTLCRKAAEVLGISEDTAKWKEQEKLIKKAFIKEYLDERGDLKVEKTQTAYAVILYLGLYEEENCNVLKDGLLQQLQSYQNHLSTGFVGTGMLMDALVKCGLEENAYSLLLQEDYPGWLREVNLGATTIWERWNSVNDDGTISDLGMNSLNHYAYGCVTGWMYENMCGFKLGKAGEIMIRPIVDRRLRFVKGSYRTVYGECKVSWEWENESKLFIAIQIPFQAKGKVMLPWGEERELESGIYFFES